MPARHSPESVAASLQNWLRERLTIADDAPIPLDALATQLGLVIETFDPALYPGTLGFLEPGEDLIFLRAGLAEPVRRFTLAHELGHAALHRREGLAAEIAQRGAAAWIWPDEGESPSCDDSDLDTPAADEDETLRPGQAYSARAQREGEANAFAAALLLPADAVRVAYAALCAHRADRPALALAQRFAVSEEVALRRLTALLRAEDDEDAATSSAPTSAAPAPARLDSAQRRAARAKTPALIVAGPGSGKTSALLARVAHLTDEQGVAPERVLALTFSRKAAEELRVRLARLMGERALMPRVSTIHAFCGDILRRYGPLVGLRPDYRLITDVEGYFILRHIVNRAPLTHYTPLSGPKMYFRDLLSSISRAKDDLIGPVEYRAAAEAMARAATTPESQLAAERALEVAAVYADYQAALDARGDADYADMIAKVWRLLQDAPDIAADLRERYEHILVDEFQDINYSMGALLRELAGRRGALWAVGDVDQAIYRFRGATPSNLLRFKRDFDGARVIQLGRNYRSRPQILRAASAFACEFLPGEQRVALTATRDDTETAPAVQLAIAPDDEAELDGLAEAMLARAAAGIPLREQAVLLRTHRYVKQVCEGLRARGVPAQLAAPLLDQPLIKTLLATVSLTVDPLAAGLLRAGEMVDHPFSDEDARVALQLAREHHVAPLEAPRLKEARAALTPAGIAGQRRLARIIAELRAAPSVAVGLGRYIFSLTTLGQRLLADEARVEAAQVARLLELCGAFDAQRASGGLLDAGDGAPLTADWAGLLDYISALRELGREAGAVEAASDVDAALVLTAHAGKGLEFPVVYLPQLAKNRFPTTARPETVPAPPGLLRDRHEHDQSDLTEEASAFYVAMTRARDTLVLSHADRYGKRAYTPSPFLTPIERALGDTLQRLRWDGAESVPAPARWQTPSDEQVSEPAPPGTISLGELEAYLRCPQQYAYQYVYGLRPAPAPFVSLRVALHEASGAIGERFVSGEAPTLEDALALFRTQWDDARANALHPNGPHGAGDSPARDDSMAAVYRQHGERLIERLWRELRDGAPPPNVAPSTRRATAGSLRNASDAASVSVTLAGATITGALDRVERVERVERAERAPQAPAPAAAQPATRVTRLHAGGLGVTNTVRDLFHLLAAEQLRQDGRAVELMRASLASGEAKPLTITAAKRGNLEGEVSAALDGLARAKYPPKPEARTCAACPFALICPA